MATILETCISIVYDYQNYYGGTFGQFHGVLGLAPSAPNGTELYIETLKKQGIIDKAAFNIDYRYSYPKYTMTFGGFDSDRAPSLSNFTFTDIYDDDLWTVGISSMKYGDLEFGGQAVKALLDTPETYLRLPSEDFKRWWNHISYGKSCNKNGQGYRCSCTSHVDGTFDSIYISFKNYQYEIGPENYISMTYQGSTGYCNFLIRESEYSSNVTVGLGQTFLKNFNVYYDLENKQVGIHGENIVFTGSSEDTEGGDNQGGDTEGEDTEGGDTEDENDEVGFIIGIVNQLLGFFTKLVLLAILLIASLILNLIFICFFCISRKEKDEEDEKQEPLLNPRGDSV